MRTVTHILAGLVIGKATGDFTTALTGSLVMDLDHAISYYRHGILFNPRELSRAMDDENDPWGDQRGFMHNILSWIAISILLIMINVKVGIIFSIAYFVHLVLDALDGADFYPLYPSRKWVIKGPIKYYSKQETIFDIFLAIVFLSLFVV